MLYPCNKKSICEINFDVYFIEQKQLLPQFYVISFVNSGCTDYHLNPLPTGPYQQRLITEHVCTKKDECVYGGDEHEHIRPYLPLEYIFLLQKDRRKKYFRFYMRDKIAKIMYTCICI